MLGDLMQAVRPNVLWSRDREVMAKAWSGPPSQHVAMKLLTLSYPSDRACATALRINDSLASPVGSLSLLPRGRAAHQLSSENLALHVLLMYSNHKLCRNVTTFTHKAATKQHSIMA